MASNRAQNEKVLRELEEGDLVVFPRKAYDHWGVYVGNGEVVHLTGDMKTASTSASTYVSALENAEIKRDSFWTVVQDSLARNGNDLDGQYRALPGKEVKQRALKVVGQKMSYNLTEMNCEHFAKLCRYGEASSDQAVALKDLLQKTAVTGGITVAAAAAILLSMLVPRST